MEGHWTSGPDRAKRYDNWEPETGRNEDPSIQAPNELTLPKLRQLFALPAVFLLITLASFAWQSSKVTNLAPGRCATETCASGVIGASLREHCDSLSLAVIGLAMSLSLITIKLLGFGVCSAAARMAWSGTAPLGPASKLAYRVSVFGSFANLALSVTLIVVCLQLTWMRLLGISYLGLDLAMIGLMLFVSCVGIVRLLGALPPAPQAEPVALSGMAAQPDEQPELAAILERISRSLHVSAPEAIVYGLEPAIQCTRRPVRLDGEEIRGLTLFLSLPLCRLLSESELIALIAGELAKCELVPADWEAWITGTFARWQLIAETRNSSYFDLLWLWMEQWSVWSLTLSLHCARRATVIAGRENTAAGLVLSALVQRKWEAFLAQVQLELQRGAIDPTRDAVNLSTRFASLMTAMRSDLAANYWSTEEPESAGLPDLAKLLQVDPSEIGQRIARGAEGPAFDRLTGIERIEVELSAQQIRRIFFV